MRWRLLEGFRLGTPINFSLPNAKVSICLIPPRQTNPLRPNRFYWCYSACQWAILAGRDIPDHTTDVAETRGEYPPASRASSPRNHCSLPRDLPPPEADDTPNRPGPD